MQTRTNPETEIKLISTFDRQSSDELFAIASGDYDQDQPLFGLEFVNRLLQSFVEEGKLADDFFGVDNGKLTPSADFFGKLAVELDGEIKVTMLGLKRAIVLTSKYGCLPAFKLNLSESNGN